MYLLGCRHRFYSSFLHLQFNKFRSSHASCSSLQDDLMLHYRKGSVQVRFYPWSQARKNKKEVVMKVGVFLLASEQAADPAVVAKKAEELGFASFWVPEHPILP